MQAQGLVSNRSLLIGPILLFISGICVAQAPVVVVRGSVLDGAGGPVGDAEVLVGRRIGRTTASGAFFIDSISPGRYTVTVRKVGFAPLRELIEVPEAGLAGRVYRLLKAPTVLSTVMVVAARPGIFGTVSLEGARPAVGARIDVIGPRGSDVLADIAGRFAFPRLGAGSYLVRVTLMGWSERRIAVQLGRDTGQELSITLVPSGLMVTRSDDEALEDLGKRLSFGLRSDRVMRDELALRGVTNVCDLPQLRSTLGGRNRTITLILNGTDVYLNTPVYTLCSWRADEVELVEFAPTVCSDVSRSVEKLFPRLRCTGFSRRQGRGPTSISGQTGSMHGGDGGPFVILWERR